MALILVWLLALVPGGEVPLPEPAKPLGTEWVLADDPIAAFDRRWVVTLTPRENGHDEVWHMVPSEFFDFQFATWLYRGQGGLFCVGASVIDFEWGWGTKFCEVLIQWRTP